MKKFIKYWAIFSIELKNHFVYLADFILSNLSIVVAYFVSIQLWLIGYGVRQEISGISKQELIWYLLIVQVIHYSIDTTLMLNIEADVQSGNITNYLNKPYNYILYTYCTSSGRVVLNLIINFTLSTIMALFFTKSFMTSLGGILQLAPVLFFGFLIHFILQCLCGIAAFWVERATVFVWVLNTIMMVLGGGLIPIDTWPDTLKPLADYTPFSAIFYYPAKLFIHFKFDLFVRFLISQLFWIVLLGSLLLLEYKRAIRKLDINGG
jgi:ABC-2 type transport system permease protein